MIDDLSPDCYFDCPALLIDVTDDGLVETEARHWSVGTDQWNNGRQNSKFHVCPCHVQTSPTAYFPQLTMNGGAKLESWIRVHSFVISR